MDRTKRVNAETGVEWVRVIDHEADEVTIREDGRVIEGPRPRTPAEAARDDERAEAVPPLKDPEVEVHVLRVVLRELLAALGDPASFTQTQGGVRVRPAVLARVRDAGQEAVALKRPRAEAPREARG